jgi:CheY-like chemotaxis protein
VTTEPTLVLLVEDDPSLRELLCNILEDEGYIVVACQSGALALATLQELTPALIITDLHMETHQAGMDVFRCVRQQFAASTATLPVVIYSANTLLLKLLEPEITAHNGVTLAKPFDLEWLIELARLLTEPKERVVGI